ncbi:response regulator [Candidatus Cloacimonadota bacterium]
MTKKISILLAEDEAIIAQYLKMELEQNGYEVCGFVASGEEAITKVRELNPDLILMDINLSGEIDGIDAAHEIRTDFQIPIIFMTGYSEHSLVDRAKEVKPVAYLEKPVELYDLQPVIDSIVI